MTSSISSTPTDAFENDVDLDSPIPTDDIAAWLAKQPPAITGQGGRSTTWRVIRHVVESLGIAAGSDLILRDYNPRCSPPWTDREIATMCEKAATTSGKPASSRVTKKPVVEALDADTLDKAYRVLIEGLKLTSDDRASFRARGLSDEEIDRLGYKSWPSDIDRRKAILSKMVEAVGEENILNVPGVCRDGLGHLDFTLKGGGFVVSSRDYKGRILGLRVRILVRSTNKKGEPTLKDGQPVIEKKYFWLSGRKEEDFPNDARISARCHVPLHPEDLDLSTIVITEGEIKSDIPTMRTGVLYIGLPGVGSWELGLTKAIELGAKRIIACLDSDLEVNKDVAAATVRLCDEAKKRGIKIAAHTWDGVECGKGIDDVITSGKLDHVRTLEADALDVFLDGLAKKHKIKRDLPEATDLIEEMAKAKPKVERSEPVDTKPDWKKRLQKKGKAIKGNHFNVSLYLRNAIKWTGKLAWDEFGQTVCWTGTPPWADDYPETASSTLGTPWTEEDTTRLVIDCNEVLRMDVAENTVRKVSYLTSKAKPYHPVRDYLSGLTWDGTDRLASSPADLLGVAETEFTKKVFTWWMVQAVRRIFEPGSPAKYILVLEGDQDIGKSTFLRLLCGDQWFSDSPLHVGTLAGQLGLAGTWIQELAEGAILRKADEAELKQYIGSNSDKYQRKFANENTVVPRQTVFAMSINPKSGGYLHDSTGNVRYWPIFCTRVDFDALVRDRDQLWAEAVHLYNQGLVPEPRTDEEKALLREPLGDREVESVWHSTVEAALEGKAETTVAEVLSDVLKIEPRGQTQKDMIEVTKILGRLGFGQSPNRPLRDGKRVRVYVRELPVKVEAPELSGAEDDAHRVLLRNGWKEEVLADGRRVLTQGEVEPPEDRAFTLRLAAV